MQIRLYSAWLTMVLLTTHQAVADDRTEQSSTPESLQVAVVDWQENMFSDDIDVRVATLDRMWPSSSDVAALFPANAEKLSQFLDAVKKRAKKRLETAPAEALAREREKLKSIRNVKTIDARAEDTSRSHEKVLRMIPKEVPVYRVVIQYEKGAAGSSSYIYVNDHWIHFQNFTSLPEILPRLDELLEQISDRE
jgi:hypothetical protein